MAINIDPILSEVNDLCSADKANINNAIFERYLEASNFAQHHEVMTEIRANGIIPIIDAKPDYGFLKVSQGNCQTNICDYDATSSSKKWNPVDYDCRVVICKEDLECDFRKFWNMKCKDFDNMNDAFIQFLVEKLKESQNASMWRIGYFDDSANVDPLYAGVDGLFKQWLALAPVGSPQRIAIPENAEATIAEQMQLAPDRAYLVFKAMYDYVAVNNTALLQTPGLHFDVTPELAYNYLQYLQENKEVLCCFSQTDGITSSRYGIDGLNYMGIPIYIRNEWSEIIKWQQATSGSVNYNNPHRAVLTYTTNKPVGTCDNDAFRSFDMWYERKDKQIYIDLGTSFDIKVIVDSDFVIAI